MQIEASSLQLHKGFCYLSQSDIAKHFNLIFLYGSVTFRHSNLAHGEESNAMKRAVRKNI